MNFSILTDS